MMKKTFFVTGLFAAFAFGCARVEVQAPKDPIKMDINMRLDVYQHVVKDIDDIESIVTGKEEKKMDLAGFFVSAAHADDLSPEVEKAAMRRRDRRSQIVAWEASGAVGENRSGLLTVRGQIDGAAQNTVNEENNDRMIIYRALAQKNGTSVESIEKVYAERLQKDAPAGTPIEDAAGNWSVK